MIFRQRCTVVLFDQSQAEQVPRPTFQAPGEVARVLAQDDQTRECLLLDYQLRRVYFRNGLQSYTVLKICRSLRRQNDPSDLLSWPLE